MRRQYSRNASDVQPPVAATISGGTPARRRMTAPPMWKLWPWMYAIASGAQMEWQKARKVVFVR